MPDAAASSLRKIRADPSGPSLREPASENLTKAPPPAQRQGMCLTDSTRAPLKTTNSWPSPGLNVMES